MKKEIENLLKDENNFLVINEICYLNKFTENAFGEKVDGLELCFNSLIKEIYYKSVVINSRELKDIVEEIEKAIINYMNEITEIIIKQLKN